MINGQEPDRGPGAVLFPVERSAILVDLHQQRQSAYYSDGPAELYRRVRPGAWEPTFAAIALAVFPTLVVYLVLNQQVIKVLTAGSLKG
jgi:ABC-type glycerol-3-phosphate transport system permease component